MWTHTHEHTYTHDKLSRACPLSHTHSLPLLPRGAPVPGARTLCARGDMHLQAPCWLSIQAHGHAGTRARSNARMHAGTDARRHGCTHACMHARMHSRRQAGRQARTQARRHARTHTHTHTHKQTNTIQTRIHADMYNDELDAVRSDTLLV